MIFCDVDVFSDRLFRICGIQENNQSRNAAAPSSFDVEDLHLCGTQSNGPGLNSAIGLSAIITDEKKIGLVSPE